MEKRWLVRTLPFWNYSVRSSVFEIVYGVSLLIKSTDSMTWLATSHDACPKQKRLQTRNYSRNLRVVLDRLNADTATSGPLLLARVRDRVYGCRQHNFLARSKQVWNKFSVVSVSLLSASLNLLPWLCALVQTASQSGGTYKLARVANCHPNRTGSTDMNANKDAL